MIEVCARQDPSFADLKPLGQELTPYAVELRYDAEFWPSADTARQAVEAATAIHDFIGARLPRDMQPSGNESPRA